MSGRRRRRLLFVRLSLQSQVLTFSDTFDNDVDGWTAGANTTLAWSAGRMSITNAAPSTNGHAYREIAVTPSTPYRASIDNASSAGNSTLRVGTTANGVEHGESATIGAGATGTVDFTPDGATVFITYRNSFSGDGSNRLADNVSVQEAI